MKLDPKKSGIALAGAGLVTIAAIGGTAAFADDTTSDASTNSNTITGEASVDHREGGRGHFDTAAEYLGLTETELFTELEAGKTLAEVAQAQGKTVEGLVDALLAAEEAEITEMVNNPLPVGPAHEGERGGHGRGHHGFGGHDWNGDSTAEDGTES